MPDDQPQLDLDHACYGKDGVRVLVSTTQSDGTDGVRDLTFGVRVWGPFAASYRYGDNTEIVPSDSLRRHLLQVAASMPDDSPELICAAAAAQIRDANPSLTAVLVESNERIWESLARRTSLVSAPARLGSAHFGSAGPAELAGGVDDLELLATRGSAFTGFRRDRLTVQAEAVDRPLCGTLQARWCWLSGHQPTLSQSRTVVTSLAATLADLPSNAIQELLARAGAELLERVSEITELRLKFAALPLTAIPSELATATGPAARETRAHEVGDGPLGVTEAQLRRAPSPA